MHLIKRHLGAVESPKSRRGNVGMVWGGPFKEEIPDLSPGRYTRNV